MALCATSRLSTLTCHRLRTGRPHLSRRSIRSSFVSEERIAPSAVFVPRTIRKNDTNLSLTPLGAVGRHNRGDALSGGSGNDLDLPCLDWCAMAETTVIRKNLG
jgi:hypothetical protein